MRARKIDEARPDAMVCIGGMAGIFDEVADFTKGRRARPPSSFSSRDDATKASIEAMNRAPTAPERLSPPHLGD
jgi:hypothetical protein